MNRISLITEFLILQEGKRYNMKQKDLEYLIAIIFEAIHKDNLSPSKVKKVNSFFTILSENNEEESIRSIRLNIRKIWDDMSINFRKEQIKDLMIDMLKDEPSYEVRPIDCSYLQCPLKLRRKNDISMSEFVVKTVKNESEIDIDFYINKILERLDISGEITEAFLFDPYLDATNMSTISYLFLDKLHKVINPLIGVTSKCNTPKFETPFGVKKLKVDICHDRFIIVQSGGKWTGVVFGQSINGFPVKENINLKEQSKYFLILRMESDDAEILSSMLKNYI